ncbi:MAG: cation diffusion facilitator family transporter [Deltaproteobacteria bacterium]|nr:cation diffusion facilitator family transporter [Deltaproteobacteria bacterium]
MEHGGSLKVVLGSLAGNVAIVIAKVAAAVVTGSGSMLGEAIHSSADCMNQVLLLVGARQAQKPPSASHPMGYGRSAYFWSFVVALMLFFGGGVFSIREGFEKLHDPEPLSHLSAAVVILLVSLVIEALSLGQAARELNRRRGAVGFFTYLRQTTDADLVVLFAENGGDVVGLLLALGALGLSVVTGDPRWDAMGSLGIGVLLTLIAGVLAREVTSLLLGERADPAIERAFREEAAADPELGPVLRVITVQQGPAQVMIAAKIFAKPGLDAAALAHAYNRLESRMRARCPEVKWQFLEPDVED